MSAAATRDRWVDYAKGIGILLMVYAHVARGLVSASIGLDDPTWRMIDSVIYTFHMPLFFFLSGLFFYGSLQKRGVQALVLTKVDTILYPYIVWSLLQGTAEVLLSRYTNGSVGFAQVLNLLEPRAQFWFLYALFQLMLLGALIYRWLNPRQFLYVVLAFALVFLMQDQLPDFMHADYVYYSFVFFALGVWFNTWKEHLLRHARLLLPPMLALFVAGQWLFHVRLGMNYHDIGPGLLALTMVSILCVVLLSAVLEKLEVGWLLQIGASSLAIYLMHILIGSGIRVLLQKVLHVQAVELHLLLGVLFAVVIPVGLLALFRRYRLMFLIEAPQTVSGYSWYRKTMRI